MMWTGEAMRILRFRELRVYQQAFQASLDIQKVSATFPPQERYSLTDQVRRSSRAVCAMIGEAWQNRRYEKSFISKLREADAEAAETQVWLDFALAFGYIDRPSHASLLDRYDHIGRQLNLMMASVDKWTS